MAKPTQQSVILPDIAKKSVVPIFDAEGQSSDGGAILLGQLDQQLGLTSGLAAQFCDRRNPGRTTHDFLTILRQRVFSIAMGYSDGNDAAKMANDPILKMISGMDALGEDQLASQPTLSRFENMPTAKEAVQATRWLEKKAIGLLKKRHRRPKRITIDFDSTDDPTHGQQAFSFFNGYYDTWCFHPLLGFLSVDGHPDQFLFSARLRPGNSTANRGCIPLLQRTVAELRYRFPKAKIRVRLDGGFANPRIIAALEDLKVEYVVAMASNSVLKAKAKDWMAMAQTLSARQNESIQLFGEAAYRAKSWNRERRVILKAEVLQYEGRSAKSNPRFVITNLRHTPENVYKIYRGRGDSENRIKELLHDLDIDRTSCSSYIANQFRVLMTATAYLLYQELRWRLRRTDAGRTQVGRFREMLIKVAARVQESVRRVVVHLPKCYPWVELWERAACAVSARGRPKTA